MGLAVGGIYQISPHPKKKNHLHLEFMHGEGLREGKKFNKVVSFIIYLVC